MDQQVSHTNGIVREIEFGGESVAELATLLGPQYRLPKAGIIRPGIMVLKSGCSESDRVLYSALVKEGASWDEIDRRLGQDKDGRSKLIPKNVDYFSIHPQDCRNPRDVEQIYKLYADQDGKLRSFPVIFPVNEWWNIIPHSLRCFGTSGLKFKSDFRLIKDSSGRIVDVERMCTFPVSAEPGKRIFGGRKWGERKCDPESCSEYQKGECKFGGVIQFYIPGIKGIGVWILPTTSWYSLAEVKTTLEMVGRLTGGKIAGTFNGRAIFRLKKVEEEITRIDVETGKPVKTMQYLISLDVDMDMAELSSLYEGMRAIESGRRAAELLTDVPSHRESVSREFQRTDGGGGPCERGSSTPDSSSDSIPLVDRSPEPQAEETLDEETRDSGDSSVDTPRDDTGKGASGTRRVLTGSQLALWNSISALFKTSKEKAAKLKELTGKDSFYSLTEKEAAEALKKLTEETLQRY